MNGSLWNQIKEASEQSIKNPGLANKPLPKKESPYDPEIYVFRHGQTHDNINRIFSGWRDSKLTGEGVRQAEVLGAKLKNKDLDLCIVSPLIRAIDTAKIALSGHKDIVFEIDERIIERNYGELQGKSKEKLMIASPELAIKYRRSYDYPPPRGESMKMVEKRVFNFCEELVERVQKNNINVAVSCHGNSMRAIRRYFENLSIIEELTIENPLAQDYAQYVVHNKNLAEAPKYFDREARNRLVIPNRKMRV